MKCMKKPSGSSLTAKHLAHLDKQDTEQGLNDKIADFMKKGGDVSGFMDKLSKQERETVWQRFAYADTEQS